MQHKHSTTRSSRILAVVGLAVAAGMTLAACGGGDSAGSGSGKAVDTLQSDAPTGKKTAPKESTHSAAVNAKRPRLRLDTSPEERARLTDAYNACLQAHGVPMNTERAAAAGAKQAPPKVYSEEEQAKYQPAYDACLVKLPLQPPEMDPETNEHYADDYRAYVKCLQRRGMKIHLVPDTSVYPDGLSWTFDSPTGGNLPEAEQDRADRACTLEAFGGR